MGRRNTCLEFIGRRFESQCLSRTLLQAQSDRVEVRLRVTRQIGAAWEVLSQLVTFEQAATVFRDPLALSLYDDEHSETEERWLTLGLDESGALLVVSHTFEELGDEEALVRVISAREATTHERAQYESG